MGSENDIWEILEEDLDPRRFRLAVNKHKGTAEKAQKPNLGKPHSPNPKKREANTAAFV